MRQRFPKKTLVFLREGIDWSLDKLKEQIEFQEQTRMSGVKVLDSGVLETTFDQNWTWHTQVIPE